MVVKFEQYFELPQKWFNRVGLDPYFEAKQQYRCNPLTAVLMRLLFKVYFIALILSCCGTLLSLGTLIRESASLIEICNSIATTSFAILALEMMALMWQSGDRFNDFILKLERMFPRDEAIQVQYSIPRLTQITQRLMRNATLIYVFCILIFLMIMPVYAAIETQIMHTTTEKSLPYRIWAPCDPLGPIAYPVLYGLESVATLASVIIMLAVNLFFVAIIALICLQFNILGENLRRLQPDDAKELRALIQTHLQLIEISQEFAGLVSRTVFVNKIFSSFAICGALFQMVNSSTTDLIQFTVFLGCVVIQTFNFGAIGNALMDFSTSTAYAIYEGRWTEASKPFRMSLLCMMHRAQKPLQLNGLGFFSMSLENFSKVMTTSFSYFALLKSMYGED